MKTSATKHPGHERQATAHLVTKTIKAGDEDKAPTIEIVASTFDVDRDNDTIDQNGWRLDDYRKNPVVPFVHDYSQPPVARATETEVRGGQLRQAWEFTDREVYPFGHMIGRMYELGFMNAASVGFNPITWEYDEDRGGFNFKEQELMESSAVVVPSNRGALAQARQAGVDLGPMKGWATKQLDREGVEDVQRRFYEALWKEARGGEEAAPTFVFITPQGEFLPGKEGQVLSAANRRRAADIFQKSAEMLASAGSDPTEFLEGKSETEDAPTKSDKEAESTEAPADGGQIVDHQEEGPHPEQDDTDDSVSDEGETAEEVDESDDQTPDEDQPDDEQDQDHKSSVYIRLIGQSQERTA